MNELTSYPTDWTTKSLNNVTSLITDGAHFSPAPQEYGELIANVKDFGEQDIKYEKCTKILKKDFDYLVRQSCSPKKGDVLLSKDGTIGKVILFSGEKNIVLLSSIAIIRLIEGFDANYTKHALRSFIFDKQLYALQSGSALSRIVLSDIRKLEIPYPDLKKQQIIAKILTTVDNLIEKTQALIDKYTAIKQGMMADLFTRGIDLSGTPATNHNHGQLRPPYEQAPELYKQTELGWVPKEWEVVTIKQVAEVKGGKRLPAGAPFAGESTPFPYLRVTDMVNGWIDDSNLEFVTPEIEKNITRYKIYKDDIYVTIAGTLGLFGRIPNYLDGSQLTENAARITSFDLSSYNADYFCNYLRSNLLKPQLFKSIGVGAGVPKLALYQIEQFKVAFPSKTEQDAIIQRIDAASNNIKSDSNALLKFWEMKKGLMQDLLTGKVKVS